MWRERSEQSTPKCDPRLGENYVDSKMPANTHMCIYAHIYTPPPPTHTHTNTHLHTVSEQAPFCRLTGSNISPEQQVCVVVVVMMMVEVVRLSPLPGSPRSLPLPRRLRSESDPSNDSHRHDAHRKHPEQEKKNKRAKRGHYYFPNVSRTQADPRCIVTLCVEL